jgi:hypothetical protein
MPFRTRKMPGKNCYRVYKPQNKRTGKAARIFAKCTSLKNAQSQLRLLRAIEYGKNFVPRRNVTMRRRVNTPM